MKSLAILESSVSKTPELTPIDIVSRFDDKIESNLGVLDGLSIDLDWNEFTPEMADKLDTDAAKFINELKEAMMSRFHTISPEQYEKARPRHDNYTVRIKGLPKIYRLRELESANLKHFICVTGIIVKSSTILPYLKIATFHCPECDLDLEVEQLSMRDITFPPSSEGCTHSKCEFMPEDSKFENTQLLTLQENPEEASDIQPMRITLRIPPHLMNIARAGDRVNVYGVLRAELEKKTSRICGLNITVNNIEPLSEEARNPTITEEDMATIMALSKEEDLLMKVARSIAPSIYGYENIKLSLALLLVGGESKKLSDETRIRGEINALLIGDPGVAKSALLQYVHSLSPRGIYSAGRGSSGVGLTAAVVREPNSDSFSLEAGAMVLANGGVACLDEFDKMSKDDREAIHEPLAQQTITIHKGGINATLNAKCAVLAAANPRDGRYNSNLTIRNNISFPTTLLTRFDFIWVIKDKPSADMDERVASHVLSFHSGGGSETIPVPLTLLKKYVAVSRNLKVTVSKSADDYIKKFYLSVRNQSSNQGEEAPMSITVRYLETLLRITEAVAKLRLKTVANDLDAMAAVNLLEDSLTQIGYDPDTGRIDIDIAEGRPSHTDADMRSWVLKTIDEEVARISFGDKVVSTKDILSICEEVYKMNRDDIRKILNELHVCGTLKNPAAGQWSRVKN